MAGIGRTVLTLRFYGDDLDPAKVTALIGAEPTKTELKGHVWPSGRVSKAGSWRLSVGDREPGDLDGQIRELFYGLTENLEVWADLSARYDGDLFCGLFMESSNEGLDLEPDTLAMIGSRGLRLGFDIYGPVED
ncbi:DUF4279 domain-containing protein [Brevundimonas sp.]|uniref:DUF4279 domain-containing protein n=1 Tax=Brevundimonas sp. TaxID=1871086 RepID=UPI0026049228|nr:DUF4279 domain-containing protein [Brevundimonas sp.]